MSKESCGLSPLESVGMCISLRQPVMPFALSALASIQAALHKGMGVLEKRDAESGAVFIDLNRHAGEW